MSNTNYILKKLKLPNNLIINLNYLNNYKILSISTIENPSNLKYFVVPFSINIKKEFNNLFFNIPNNQNNLDDFNSFFYLFFNYIKDLNKIYKKKLVLKGMGFKINYDRYKKMLELKLGFSHLHLLPIISNDTNLSISVIKNTISIEGLNKTIVGNFADKIRNLKYPNTYKEKGFWYKNENRILRIIKKK